MCITLEATTPFHAFYEMKARTSFVVIENATEDYEKGIFNLWEFLSLNELKEQLVDIVEELLAGESVEVGGHSNPCAIKLLERCEFPLVRA